ncbi:DUF6233 domain-containing protein [Streptomyces hundungensis]|uniref:DUF6233 domain-containing protein n=1 Tax=Streptomyces hundungensis TaxID=1077946 RepID=UPI0033EC0CF0
MYDPPPSELSRLAKLRVVEEYQAHQLERTRAAIRELEAEQERQRERDKKRRIEVSWKLQPSLAEGGVALLHRADCGLYTKEMGYLNAMEAQIAMSEEGIECCQVCRPQD